MWRQWMLLEACQFYRKGVPKKTVASSKNFLCVFFLLTMKKYHFLIKIALYLKFNHAVATQDTPWCYYPGGDGPGPGGDCDNVSWWYIALRWGGSFELCHNVSYYSSHANSSIGTPRTQDLPMTSTKPWWLTIGAYLKPSIFDIINVNQIFLLLYCAKFKTQGQPQCWRLGCCGK